MPDMEQDGFVMVPRVGEGEEPSSNRHTTHQDVEFPEFLADIDAFIDNVAESLWPLNSFIHDNPELAFQEHKAHDALTSFMRARKEGWKVTPSAYGMETAWVAIYDSGRPGPSVSFNIEMDALPNLGHACGHNLIATASLAAGLATASLIRHHNLPGKVVLFGTPGEETYRGGKIRLLEQHAYDHVDISLISHPGITHNNPLVRTTAFARLEARFLGRAAHAAKDPWRGVNALDALVVAYTAVAALRQQTMPGDVIGFAITDGGGETTNVIHEHAACVCVLRAGSEARLEVLKEKVSGCLRAGGEGTGARVEVKVTQGYKDHVPNRVLAGVYRRYWNALGDVPEPLIPPEESGEAGVAHVMSSTDQGDVSYVVPSVNASFAIPPGPLGGQPHSPDFERASGTREAFERALRVAKALAGIAAEVLTRDGLLDEVKKAWRRDMEHAKDPEKLVSRVS